MLLTAVLQALAVYALVIKTKSNSISSPENARQRLAVSTNIAQCNHLTPRLGPLVDRLLHGGRGPSPPSPRTAPTERGEKEDITLISLI